MVYCFLGIAPLTVLFYNVYGVVSRPCVDELFCMTPPWIIGRSPASLIFGSIPFLLFLMCSRRDPNLLVCVLCLLLSHYLVHE